MRETEHFKVVCRVLLAGTDPAPGAGANPKTNTCTDTSPPSVTSVDPWMFMKCYSACDDKHAQKCHKQSCREKRNVALKEPSTDPKASISKAALKVLKPPETKPEEEAEKPADQIAELEKQRDNTKKWGWNDMMEAAETKLEEIRKKKTEVERTKYVKTIPDERHRLEKNHETKVTKLEEDLKKTGGKKRR